MGQLCSVLLSALFCVTLPKLWFRLDPAIGCILMLTAVEGTSFHRAVEAAE